MAEVGEFSRVVSFPGVGSFIPVNTGALRIGQSTDFDIYLPPHTGSPPILYRERSLPFTEQVRTRLLSNHITELYVRVDQEEDCRRYLEQNLPDILADPNVSLEERSEILYAVTRDLLRDIMGDPRSPELIERSLHVVSTSIWHMSRERTAFEHLLRVTSFDYYTYTHSVNVFVFSTALAQRAGIDAEDDLNDLGVGALLHDVGKSLIDTSIIRKRGTLTREEWDIMKRHPLFGEEILSERRELGPRSMDIVRHHHEKLGGRGYPDKLDGEALTPFAKIAAIADIFDALTTRRSYKGALPSFPALKLMREEMGSELDPGLFRLFVEMMGRRK